MVGLQLLEKEAGAAADELLVALKDESPEVKMMAAWTLVKVGKEKPALEALSGLLFNGSQNDEMLHNILDWMGEPALPLVKEYFKKGGERKGKYGSGILAHIAETQGF